MQKHNKKQRKSGFTYGLNYCKMTVGSIVLHARMRVRMSTSRAELSRESTLEGRETVVSPAPAQAGILTTEHRERGYEAQQDAKRRIFPCVIWSKHTFLFPFEYRCMPCRSTAIHVKSLICDYCVIGGRWIVKQDTEYEVI